LRAIPGSLWSGNPKVGRVTRATHTLIERLAHALGPPIATPEIVSADGGKLQRARYRVWRWACPACGAGYDDELGLYSPLVVDSDGRVWCDANQCSAEAIAAGVKLSTEAGAA
jgi:hypothetical protein